MKGVLTKIHTKKQNPLKKSYSKSVSHSQIKLPTQKSSETF